MKLPSRTDFKKGLSKFKQKIEVERSKITGKIQDLHNVIPWIGKEIVFLISALIALSIVGFFLYYFKMSSEGAITIMAAIGAGLVTFITYVYQKENNRHKLLIEVFKQLEDPKHRNARRRVYRLSKIDRIGEAAEILADMNALKEKEFRMVKDNNPKCEESIKDIKNKIRANYLESKEMVKADFEYVGVLVRNGLIPAEEFIKVYWSDITLLSGILEYEIKEMHKNNRSYMENFLKLDKRCIDWRVKNSPRNEKNSLPKVDYNEENFKKWEGQ
jgi:hypothetical protein